MKILIVDDEHLARNRLQRMLADDERFEVVAQAGNGVEAVQQANVYRPDLVLLDIRMPGMDGLEAAGHMAEMEEPPAVIFCTAYEEHAIEAFNVNAVGYLLKPVRKDKLLTALESAKKVNKVQLVDLFAEEETRRTHISARTRLGIELVPVDEVRYFQADQKYVTVRHGEGELIIDETLRDLEDEFPNLFVRIHRNALVAAKFIAGLEREDGSHSRIRMQGIEETLDVSRRHVPSVRKFVKNL